MAWSPWQLNGLQMGQVQGAGCLHTALQLPARIARTASHLFFDRPYLRFERQQTLLRVAGGYDRTARLISPKGLRVVHPF